MTECFCVGVNAFAQCGLGTKCRDDPSIPEYFGLKHSCLRKFREIACGAQFTVVVDESGDVYICGTLNGTVLPALTKIVVPYASKCVRIACGRKHLLVLLEGGYVLSWGVGYFGQLGLGDDSCWDSPQMIHSLMPSQLGRDVVVQVAAGSCHSGAITASGRLFMWGLNRNGQCGIGSKSDSVADPRPVELSAPVKMVACGRSHSAALTLGGQIYTWGSSTFGKLGLKDCAKNVLVPTLVISLRTVPIHSIYSGDHHMLALHQDGRSVLAWGYGAEGQLGQGNQFHSRTPLKVDAFDDILSYEGKSGHNLAIISLTAGATWNFAVTSNGLCYAWGYGDGGWLGISTHNLANPLPIYDSDVIEPNIPYARIASFDSRLNCLVPQRVNIMVPYFVQRVVCGSGHSIFVTVPRDPNSELPDARSDWDPMMDSSSKSTMRGTVAKPSSSNSSNNSNNSNNNKSILPLVTNDQFLSWCRHNKIMELTQCLTHAEPSERTSLLEGCDTMGNSPLLVACQNGHAAVVELFLSYGVNVNKANDKGNTALHFCSAYGFAALGKLLERHGADGYATNLEGLTSYEGLSLADLENL